MIMPGVRGFEAYREYLRAYYLHRKSVTPGYSYRAFAEAAHARSPNYLKLVIDGKRNLTVENIHEFAGALGLSGDDREYFEAMVLENQARSPREKSFYAERMARLRRRRPSRSGHLKPDALLSEWFSIPLYLCLQDQPTESAQENAARRLGLPMRSVSAAVEQLLAKGLLRVEDGHYRISFEHVTFHSPERGNAAQRDYLKSQLLASVEAFNRTYSASGKFFSHTFSISAANYPRYVDHVKRLLSLVTEDCQADPCEQLVQLNVQLFPLESRNQGVT